MNEEMEMLYCITCEQVVLTNVDREGTYYHEVAIVHDDYIFCEGPFTQCPMPEMIDEEWDALFATDEEELLNA